MEESESWIWTIQWINRDVIRRDKDSSIFFRLPCSVYQIVSSHSDLHREKVKKTKTLKRRRCLLSSSIIPFDVHLAFSLPLVIICTFSLFLFHFFLLFLSFCIYLLVFLSFSRFSLTFFSLIWNHIFNQLYLSSFLWDDRAKIGSEEIKNETRRDETKRILQFLLNSF